VSNIPRLAGLAVAALALGGMALASVAPMGFESSGEAFLRISLGVRPERIERCRTLSDEELAKVAPQMRQRVVCEGTTARYRFELSRDGTPLVSRVVRGGGLRHDRPIYFAEDLRIPAGRSSVEMRMVRLDSAAARDPEGRTSSTGVAGERIDDGRAEREADEYRRGRAAVVPASLVLRSTVTLRPREVLLLTFDPASRRLVAIRDSSR
jgi:hypothetical protein